MKKTKRIHKMWKMHQQLPIAIRKKISLPFGKWQYLYTNKKGQISCIKLQGEIYGERVWEIFCLKGDLFRDVYRFTTIELAEEKIKKYLEKSK